MSTSVEFLTRTGCSLCGESEPFVRQMATLLGMSVRRIDIDAGPDLAESFGARIPVIRLPGGRVLAEGRLDRGQLIRAMLMARIHRS